MTGVRNRVTRVTTKTCAVALAGVLAGGLGASIRTAAAGNADTLPNLLAFDNASGQGRTFNTRGILDPNNPFFQSLGTNDRACVTCHRAEEGWTMTPAGLQRRFADSGGTDPVFRSNDGSNCAGADLTDPSTRQAAFSLLLSRGLIRIGLDVPPGAEFVIESVDDPYQCNAGLISASMYRRPLPATNLTFLSAVMWDGRESSAGRSLTDSLLSQALDATLGHAQASLTPTPAELHQIVDFETGLYTAQSSDRVAGGLGTRGATGGPVALSHQPFFIGINDPLGQNPTGAAFDEIAFTLFDPWSTASSSATDGATVERAAIVRGQKLFNSRAFNITDVGGLNDDLHKASIGGTCTTCHDTPNVGNHSVKAPLDLGLTNVERRTPDMPLYTLRNLSTGDTRQTTDPGRAMITGKWRDVGRFKGPVLRGLAGRAPYFHNGFAATLADVVTFYNTRFSIGLSAAEQSDLVGFLSAL